MQNKHQPLRTRVFNLLEHPLDTPLSRLVNYFIIALIVLSILATVIGSIPEIYQSHHWFFDSFEVFSLLVFTVEYLTRVWASVEDPEAVGQTAFKARLRFMLKPLSIIDALAVLPFYLGMFYTVDLLFLRFFRLLRIFKLTRYSRSLNILVTVIKNESQAFSMTLSILLTILLLSAGGIHIFEKDVQPDAFGSIPQSLWWSIATLTTVGYGDVTPVTTGGKVFGAMVMIVGIGMVALPTGILSSAFSEEIRYRRDLYLAKLDEVLEDGLISSEEELTLEMLREELQMSEREAWEMMAIARHRGRKHDGKRCPTCGKVL
ncbi:MAG: ion transporter [Thiolinea sp.]